MKRGRTVRPALGTEKMSMEFSSCWRIASTFKALPAGVEIRPRGVAALPPMKTTVVAERALVAEGRVCDKKPEAGALSAFGSDDEDTEDVRLARLACFCAIRKNVCKVRLTK